MRRKDTKSDLIKPLMRSEVKAIDIVRALTQEDDGLVHLILRHKKILGKLDLKHRLISIPVTFRNCMFLAEVDLRNCEFEQVVDFTGCTFHQKFNSGDKSGSYALYKKDLICNEAIFQADVSFVGSSFESSASFTKAEFHGKDNTVNFTSTSIGQFLRCDGAIFKGSVDFHGLKCGKVAFFNPAKIEADEEQNHTRPVTFEKAADFRFASFGVNLQCEEATFRDQADFNFLKCGDNAIFSLCNFEGEAAEFNRASIGQNLNCSGATFKGIADFTGTTCGYNAIFHPAGLEDGEGKGTRPVTFEKAAAFRFASFGVNLQCEEATFRDQADFNFLKCGDNAVFSLCNFEAAEATTDFTRLSVGGNLDCDGAIFRGPAYFERVRCGGNGLFRPDRVEGEDENRTVTFEKAADFRFSTFGVNLEFTEATFRGGANFYGIKCGYNLFLSSAKFRSQMEPVNLARASIEGSLVCDGWAAFFGELILYNAMLGILQLGDNCWFATERLDLRELTFKRFDGKPEQAEQLIKAQNPARFSRDPYIQLEQYYSSVGNDAQAKDMYYKGHLAVRKNAKKEKGSVNWSRETSAIDWLWKMLTRYGISIRRLLAIAIALILIGSLIFYLPDRYLSHDTLQLASDSADSASWEETWLYRAAYSLDLFLPLVNLHIDEKWTPTGSILQAYAVLHAMVGWLIVPLLIAALAGIMRR